MKKRFFDCCFNDNLPEMEIKADSAEEAAKLYKEAMIRAIELIPVSAIEVEYV